VVTTSELPDGPGAAHSVPDVSHNGPQARATRARHDATRIHMGYMGYVGYVVKKPSTYAMGRRSS